MTVDLETIKRLTRELALISSKQYNSLEDAKKDFDSIASNFIDLNKDHDVLPVLANASAFFNLLNEEDFKTNEGQLLAEAWAVKIRYTKLLTELLAKWRSEHYGFQ
jgi:hypothetical protein